MEYQEYKKDFLESLRNDSAINGSDTEDEFIEHTLDTLSDFDEISDPIRLGMGDKKGRSGRLMRMDGYSIDETDHSLVLFISDFQDTFDPDKLTMSRVDELYWRLYYLLDEMCNGNIREYFDDSDEIIKIGKYFKRRIDAAGDDAERILKVEFNILTNKELDTKLLSTNLLETTIRKTKGRSKNTKSTKKIKKSDFNGKPIEINLWHLERLYEMENSNNNDPIVIDVENDFPELGYKGIPCIKGNIGEDLGYEAYIAIIPGNLLANIYIEHGSKVLEGNVRAFLGTGGSKSVNSGIKKTINTDPTRFFTYNNGIATTASDVEIEEINGNNFITKIVDLQIINGGQTTASLAEAVLKRTNVNLDGIFVPMKLTVIEDRETENDDGVRFYDEMVQSIAKYANSQNKVTAADLFSNDPFHIWMERMSKQHLAPASIYNIPTGWYYERSRKRYQQEQLKLKGDNLKRFQAKFPKKQIINKEQLGMYLTTVNCKPHIVSKGKNWVMKEFGTEVRLAYQKDKKSFNEEYFKKAICSAIIFRTVDDYLEKNKDSVNKPTGFWYKTGGYKGNIVPYSIAKIISTIPSGYTLDWPKIWQKQSISPAFMHEIEIVTKMTNDFICDSHGVIVTEYCKHEATWLNFRDGVAYRPSSAFLGELITTSEYNEIVNDAGKDEDENQTLQIINDAIKLGTIYWQKVLSISKEKSLSTYTEQTAIQKTIKMTLQGLPGNTKGALATINTALNVVSKLEAEGIIISNE